MTVNHNCRYILPHSGVLFQSYCILIGCCISADSSHVDQTDPDDPLLPEEKTHWSDFFEGQNLSEHV